jgi:hypothetical protein
VINLTTITCIMPRSARLHRWLEESGSAGPHAATSLRPLFVFASRRREDERVRCSNDGRIAPGQRKWVQRQALPLGSFGPLPDTEDAQVTA